MSTHSNIAIKLRPEDRNKDFTTPWGEVVNAKGEAYLYVYCHNDGYPSGVGFDLLGMRMTYDEALEYILKGDRSTSTCAYWYMRGEKCAPWPTNKPEPDSYLYVLEETKNSNIVDVLVQSCDDDEPTNILEYND